MTSKICKWGHPQFEGSRYSNGSCKECHKKRVSEQRRQNPEKYKQYKKNQYQKSKEKQKEYYLKRSKSLKETVMNGYGGRCNCCGESALPFLTIDHIDGNGGGRKRKSHTALWRKLILENYPPGYQCLCFNCNIAKHNSGINECPHAKIEEN